MIEEIIERTARELRDEADIDFIDLPFIAANLSEDLDIRTQDEIRRHMLDVVRRLMERVVYPGDFTLDDLESGRGFQFRSGTPADLLSWIEAEWIAMDRAPNPDDPICGFALKRS